MPLQGNFNDEVLKKAGGLVVSGSFTALDGAKLVERRVALQQGDRFSEGPAPRSAAWDTAEVPLPLNGFECGPAVAIGIDVFYIGGPDTGNPGATVAYTTMVWSDSVTVVEST
jgi:hypothetical protein